MAPLLFGYFAASWQVSKVTGARIILYVFGTKSTTARAQDLDAVETRE